MTGIFCLRKACFRKGKTQLHEHDQKPADKRPDDIGGDPVMADHIRQFGGNMKETYGVPVEEIQKAIQFGVRKINIDTDIRLAMTAAVRKYMFENPDKFDARDWLKPAREAAKALCKQRYIEFGCEGQGAKIKANSLQVVAERYARGELAQVVQ